MTVEKETKSQKMSILWISFFLDNPALLNILRQFAELGHEVSLISVQTKNVSRIRNAQMRIISIPLRHVPLILPVMFTIFLFFYLPIFVIISKPDVIIMEPYVHILSAFPQLLISRFKKVKSVLDVRSTPVETTGFRGFLQAFWFSASILTAKKLFDGVTIITPLMKKEVCCRFNLDPAKVGVWTSGVSDNLFNPQNLISESAELKRKLGLAGKFVVFYHGVFTATRGLQETIKAMKISKHRYSNAVLFLLGTGPIISRLKALIQKEDLQDTVIIHDPIDHSEVPKFIGISDVCIVPLPYHPYWRFQSPLKLLEYLAMEKVVIATDIPAHRSVIGEERCGIYISSIEPVEIARAIEYAYLNKENLEEWGKVGREIIREKYTWEKVAKDLENYLSSIDDRTDLV
jgi:glycosyltransferase involved in cell wall biosynthesis